MPPSSTQLDLSLSSRLSLIGHSQHRRPTRFDTLWAVRACRGTTQRAAPGILWLFSLSKLSRPIRAFGHLPLFVDSGKGHCTTTDY